MITNTTPLRVMSLHALLYCERLNDTYVHPHTGQSLAYSRMVELELRLLEKEWTGESQLPLS